jgi:hypothetical protein
MEQISPRVDLSATTNYASLRNYIFWSTLIGLFSVLLVIRIPFQLRFFDGVMVMNLVLMSLFVDLARIPKWVLLLILYLAVSGGIGIGYGTDTVAQVAKQFLGISVSLLYFCYFFQMIEDDYERAFLAYAKMAFWFAVIALPLWIGRCLYLGHYERLQGLTPEPGWFCELVIPATYWYAHQFFSSRKYGTELTVLLVAITVSSSSLGYLGVAFGAMLLLTGRKRNFIAIPFVAGGLLVLAYTTSGYFRKRADDTLLAATTQDLSGANVSTYALLSNVFVTEQVFKESPIIGNGLGSHPISHERFISDLPGVEDFAQMGAADLNATEAASLTLRSLSELGVIGFLGILLFIAYFRVGSGGPHTAISNAILINFVFKLVRNGNYFTPEQFFFVLIYVLNYRCHKLEMKRNRTTLLTQKASHTVLHAPSNQGILDGH